MFFSVLKFIVFSGLVVLFVSMNLQRVLLHLFWFDLSLPLSVLVILSLLLGSLLQTSSNCFVKMASWFNPKH
ncbi:hypothetical protein EBQ91_04075 [bacterium]|nr:hypothetical protein [bacterium]